MDISNEGSSIYHRLQGLFQWEEDGRLVFSSHQVVRDQWSAIHSALQNDESSPRYPTGLKATVPSRVLLDLPDHGSVTAYSHVQPDTLHSVGLLLDRDEDANPKFEEFFVAILLAQLRLCVDRPVLDGLAERRSVQSLTQGVVDLFDARLRYAGVNDQWDATGREFFAERVRHFVSRGMKLELCLPAFPCKSSSTDKVLGTLPDRGEMMALEWLHAFVEAIEEIYPPGAKLWIVSDGHVFSDCIGADDSKVDEYTARLRELNDQVSTNTERIGFKSLVDIFSLSASASSPIALSELEDQLRLPEIPHHVATEITAEAELCRRILMSGSHASRRAVRLRIEGRDKSILALYRGFSRFMLEDLELHPAARLLSKSKRRKVATAVSFEMIMRNQAYSNLVEMIFPNHIRLSIHAHPNTGPKFGITLFDRSKVTTSSSIPAIPSSPSPTASSSSASQQQQQQQQQRQCTTDLLHIPTPWHNCVVELPTTDHHDHGSPQFLVTKAKVVRDALKRGDVEGEVEGTELQRGWKLKPKALKNVDVTAGEQERSHDHEHDLKPSETVTGDAISKVACIVSEKGQPESEPEMLHRGQERLGSDTSVEPEPEPEPEPESESESKALVVMGVGAMVATTPSACSQGTSTTESIHDEKTELAALQSESQQQQQHRNNRKSRGRGRARAVAIIQKVKNIWRITLLRRTGEASREVD